MKKFKIILIILFCFSKPALSDNPPTPGAQAKCTSPSDGSSPTCTCNDGYEPAPTGVKGCIPIPKSMQ